MHSEQSSLVQDGDFGAFEHFLTATVLTRCLDSAASPALDLPQIEELIGRIGEVVRTAAQAVKGVSHGHSNALPRHKLRAVTEHVAANLEAPLRVADLAALVAVSPFHFSRQFREATRLAPHQYVLLCRMQRAARLLAETEMAVGLIALEVGCADQSHFSNVFRRLFGCRPREFRQSVWNGLNHPPFSPAAAWRRQAPERRRNTTEPTFEAQR